jgi:hypothetical protein
MGSATTMSLDLRGKWHGPVDRALSLARPPLCPKRSAYGLAGLRFQPGQRKPGLAAQAASARSQPRLALELAGRAGTLYRKTLQTGRKYQDSECRERIRLHQVPQRSNHFSANGTVTFPFCLTNGGHPRVSQLKRTEVVRDRPRAGWRRRSALVPALVATGR